VQHDQRHVRRQERRDVSQRVAELGEEKNPLFHPENETSRQRDPALVLGCFDRKDNQTIESINLSIASAETGKPEGVRQGRVIVGELIGAEQQRKVRLLRRWRTSG
jgi:hypothetical protein